MIWVFPILRFFKHEKWKHGMKSVCFTLQVSDEKRRRRSSSSYLEYRRLWRSGHWPNWNRIEPRSVISIQSNRQRHGLFAPRCTATTQQKPPPLPPPQAQSNPFLKPFQSNVFSGRHPSLLFSLYIVCETVFCILRKARLPIYKENCGLSKKKKKSFHKFRCACPIENWHVGPFWSEGGCGTRQCSVEGVGGTGMKFGGVVGTTRGVDMILIVGSVCIERLFQKDRFMRPLLLLYVLEMRWSITSLGPLMEVGELIPVWSLACLFKRDSDFKMQMVLIIQIGEENMRDFDLEQIPCTPNLKLCIERDLGSYYHFFYLWNSLSWCAYDVVSTACQNI